MDQQQNKAQEAEAFARVWKRVSPDPDSSPIQCGEVPLAPAADPPPALGAASLKWGEFLRAQILWELTRWRTYQALARAPGSGGGSRLAALALGRAKRMAAVLFLLTGVWYLPRSPGHPPQLEDQPGGLPPAVPGAQRAELRYRAAAQNNPDPVLGDLFRALRRSPPGNSASCSSSCHNRSKTHLHSSFTNPLKFVHHFPRTFPYAKAVSEMTSFYTSLSFSLSIFNATTGNACPVTGQAFPVSFFCCHALPRSSRRRMGR